MALINKRLVLFFGAIAALLITVLFLAGRPAAPSESEREAVATTIFPLYDIVRSIAPENIDVIALLPPGSSPHTFEPNPSTIKSLERSKVLFAIGHGCDDWIADLAAASDTPVVNGYSGLELREYSEQGTHEHTHHEHAHEEGDDLGHHHHHGGTDPHYWLSMKNAIAMTATITVELTANFPEYRDEITARHNSLLGRLRDADHQIRQMLEDIETRKMVTLHGAWYYFAEEYDLEIAATFEPSPGQEPTPQYLAELEHTVKHAALKTIYSEPQLSTQSLEAFALDHGLDIATLDPLGGTEGRENYIEMMLYNARTIAENQ
ncbi:MAG: metal ABC transporter substrate-binding protein [Patescibacteria group bacterium]|nr:metal ABC transporter substrate-binding protein [Patescibacteria group bacterium]